MAHANWNIPIAPGAEVNLVGFVGLNPANFTFGSGCVIQELGHQHLSQERPEQ